ncbi:sensor domain-containing protein [Mycobacterium europaeum]|uniref:sensor domain-containing protein n=1 Tax=Mycobacterium europaeum TaxID=761804 RepID=UPI002AE0B175|nr:sensor domain-containing protein [Mycobacterium europaeum]MEA1160726.1 sensor domain-containing protein [Mycobacterium europaeum]
MKSLFVASAVGAGMAVFVVGCGGGQGGGHSAKPVPSTVTPPAAPTLAPNAIDSLILASDVVGDIVAAKLNWAAMPPPGWTRPPGPAVIDEGNPECEPLFGPNTNTVGVIYTAWRSNQYKEDKDTFEHAAYQVVATVADAKAATQLLDNAFTKPVNSCDNAVLHRKDDISRWRFQKVDTTGTDVRWTATELQNGQVTGWVCPNEARAKNNVVIYVQACQYGNGAPATAAIVDKISEKIPG